MSEEQEPPVKTQNLEVEEDDLFGDFNETTKVEEPSPQAENPTEVEEDLFGALQEIPAQLEDNALGLDLLSMTLPPPTDKPVEIALPSDQIQEEDLFGDFEATPTAPPNTDANNTPIIHAEKELELRDEPIFLSDKPNTQNQEIPLDHIPHSSPQTIGFQVKESQLADHEQLVKNFIKKEEVAEDIIETQEQEKEQNLSVEGGKDDPQMVHNTPQQMEHYMKESQNQKGENLFGSLTEEELSQSHHEHLEKEKQQIQHQDTEFMAKHFEHQLTTDNDNLFVSTIEETEGEKIKNFEHQLTLTNDNLFVSTNNLEGKTDNDQEEDLFGEMEENSNPPVEEKQLEEEKQQVEHPMNEGSESMGDDDHDNEKFMKDFTQTLFDVGK